jgi:hypothetical protein
LYTESVMTVVARPTLEIDRSLENGRLVLQDVGLYAVFQSALPAGEAMLPGIPGVQGYTYGRMMLRQPLETWRLTRTEDESGGLMPERRLVPREEPADPRHKVCADVELRQSLLVVDEPTAYGMIEQLGYEIPEYDLTLSSLAAERLFRAVSGRRLTFGGIAIEACGTFRQGSCGPSLAIVDASGGYCVGIESMPGMVTEEQLAHMGQASVVASIR